MGNPKRGQMFTIKAKIEEHRNIWAEDVVSTKNEKVAKLFFFYLKENKRIYLEEWGKLKPLLDKWERENKSPDVTPRENSNGELSRKEFEAFSEWYRVREAAFEKLKKIHFNPKYVGPPGHEGKFSKYERFFKDGEFFLDARQTNIERIC